MKEFILITVLFTIFASPALAETCPEILNVSMQRLNSKESIDFCRTFNDKVVLAVNTASNCGYTPQLKGLENLYRKYKDQGLVIVGFPSNDFDQEFDDEKKTAEVCYLNYGVTFPMMTKSRVSGEQANDFFKKLIQTSGKAPKWNFYKYLISRDGSTIKSFPSDITPEQLDNFVLSMIKTE